MKFRELSIGQRFEFDQIGVNLPQINQIKEKSVMTRLKFARGNAKLDKKVGIFSLPAGHTFPFASLCQSRSDRITGKIKDGKNTQFRCFAASAEALFKNIRVSRWNNFEALRKAKTTDAMAAVIHFSLPDTQLVRIHGSGDFFSQAYFDAWIKVARDNPLVTFYGYTKALPFWIARLEQIPSNLHLVASEGGTHDALINQHGLRFAKVVYSEKQAIDTNLEIDHDDSHVFAFKGNFALLLHGTQPAGSEAGKAYSALKRQGQSGYSGIGEYFKAKTA